jgi:pyocin large subunit-like protein
MAGTRIVLLAAAAALALTACDNGPSAVAPKQAAGTQMAESTPTGDATDANVRADRRDAPVKLVDGKPMWSASRRFSAEENAQRAFDRNGQDFGARDVDDFVEKAHAFVARPPRDVQTLTRANGDRLFYSAERNVFAVASKAGAPRTMFKPREGMAYWQEQKTREERRQANRRTREDDEA